MLETIPTPLLRDLEPHTGSILGVAPVSGGITNRNYKLETTNGAFMLRIAGERTGLLGINRAFEFASAQIAHAAGVGAPPVAYLEAHQAILSRFIPDAATLTPETASGNLERIVSGLKTYHAAPAFPGTFSPFDTVRTYHQLALEHGVRFPDNLSAILEHMTQIEQALEPHQTTRPCHNDLLPGNFLDDGQRIWIIDWEYAGNGNPFFDLGNFAVNLELDEAGCQHLLELYFGQTHPTLEAQLHLMRLASDLREAFWGYLQSGISTLEFDFVEYGQQHLERFQVNASQTKLAHWFQALK